MGLLSLTTILLSLACLAIMIGVVFAVILLWPHKNEEYEDRQTDESGRPERTQAAAIGTDHEYLLFLRRKTARK